MIVGAEDAITCHLVARRDRTLNLHVDTEEFLPGAYLAAVWATYAGNEVLRQELAITQRLTTIDLTSDVDHVGFAIFRTNDGQCVDLMEAHLILQISGTLHANSGPTMQFQDRRGRLLHEVNPAGPSSTIDIRVDAEGDDLDKNIRQHWLDRRVREREATARREGNFGGLYTELDIWALSPYIHREHRERLTYPRKHPARHTAKASRSSN